MATSPHGEELRLRRFPESRRAAGDGPPLQRLAPPLAGEGSVVAELVARQLAELGVF